MAMLPTVYNDSDFQRATGATEAQERRLIEAGVVLPLVHQRGVPRTWGRSEIRRGAAMTALASIMPFHVAAPVFRGFCDTGQLDAYDPDAELPADVRQRWFDPQSAISAADERNELRISVVDGDLIVDMGQDAVWERGSKGWRRGRPRQPRYAFLDRQSETLFFQSGEDLKRLGAHVHATRHSIDARLDESLNAKSLKSRSLAPISMAQANISRACIIAMRRLQGWPIRYAVRKASAP
jgi:hypothetical protein